MINLLTRHAIQVLMEAGHTQEEAAALTRASERSVRRIGKEVPVTHVDEAAERRERRIGRPSKTGPFRSFVAELLSDDPALLSLEIVRRCRLRGYAGGKSAMYALIKELRPQGERLGMRFEGLPGEFSQHDFGQVDVKFLDGSQCRIQFFASRLKWSRWVEVSVVEDQRVETLVRTLLDHFVAFDGVPLCADFDRPKTVALKWRKDGHVTEWNPVFAYAALEIGFGAEVCWPYQPKQKGAVENLVGWVKGSFFKQRRFHDMEDLKAHLIEWHQEVNTERPCRATDVIPAARIDAERSRLRQPRVEPDDLALRIPVSVGPTAHVTHDTHLYSMPPEAAGLPGTLYLYRDRVRIVAGRHEATHPRVFERRKGSTLAEHRAAHLAAISGKRGKRYLQRQHLFDTGEAAVRFLTEVVHRRPHSWASDVETLHDLLQKHGPDALNRAFRATVDVARFEVEYVAQCLAHPFEQQTLFDGEVPS